MRCGQECPCCSGNEAGEFCHAMMIVHGNDFDACKVDGGGLGNREWCDPIMADYGHLFDWNYDGIRMENYEGDPCHLNIVKYLLWWTHRQTTIAGVTYDNLLIVACYVYDCQLKGERVWFTKIVDNLKLLDKHQISHAIDECFDWGILYGEYGETVPGRGGRLLMVDHDARMIIDPIWCKLYEI